MRLVRRYLRNQAMQKGLLGGSRFWTVLGTLGLAMKVLKKLAKDEPDVAYRSELKPGQTLVISSERSVKAVKRRR